MLFHQLHHLLIIVNFFFFFFKQKTAYEMQRGLVGSEMCIRDRYQRRVHGDDKKGRFVEAPGDGPAYGMGKESRNVFSSKNNMGKDGHEPPSSYLKYNEWAPKATEKKDDKTKEKKGVQGRGSFIDEIFFNGEKYKMPGPGGYFKEELSLIHI
eukprot:TRINITY_DN809_c0_g1_i2.p2 TRINITY_DN809_c0_g1~~TRINITY_DN809_c0_g1_i2.p2  ORF type:complete len:153 (-),score=56.67 TRINITY_DN809_c0_g1_i2:182-640(-)